MNEKIICLKCGIVCEVSAEEIEFVINKGVLFYCEKCDSQIIPQYIYEEFINGKTALYVPESVRKDVSNFIKNKIGRTP